MSTPSKRIEAVPWRRTTLVIMTFAALLLAGCSGDEAPSTGETGDATAPGGETGADAGDQTGAPEDDVDDTIAVTVADTAGIPVAFHAFGVRQGLYEAEGLDVEVVPVQGAAPIIAGVVSGEYDLGGSDVVTFVQAIHQGLPLRMVTPGTFAPVDEGDPDADFAAMVVAPDGPIEGVQDLEDAAVAVNVLGNIAELVTRGAMEELGVAHENINLVEVPFPDMTAAVERGEVDAAFVIEPFATIAAAAGLESLFPPYTTFRPGMQVGSVVTTTEFVEANPDVVERFQRGHAATARYIAEHPDEFRAALPEITELEAGLAEQVTLPQWNEQIDRETVQVVAERMAEYGIIGEAPDLSDVFVEPEAGG